MVKKKKKLSILGIIGISIGSVLFLVLGFVGVVILNGTCFDSLKKKDPTYKDWMKDIDDNALLTSIKIPGSHDSGTNGMLWLGACQYLSIEKQLDIGVRYFDIRVTKDKDDEYVIYHGPINGTKFDPIVTSIEKFISTNKSETLILDFQHFDNSAQDYVYQKVTEKLLPYAVINNTEKTDQQFVSELTMKDVRGKCLILFGYGAYEDSNYIFRRNNDNCSNKGCSLDSFYYTERNSSNSETYIKEHIPYYIDAIKNKHAQEEYKALSVLQCQLTDGNLIFGPYSKEKTHSKNMSKYIKNLKNNENFDEINIIMRDFVNPTKVKEIIDLNF